MAEEFAAQEKELQVSQGILLMDMSCMTPNPNNLILRKFATCYARARVGFCISTVRAIAVDYCGPSCAGLREPAPPKPS